MQDIGVLLENIIQKENCPAVCAFFLLDELEEIEDGIYIRKSKPAKEFDRRLRDKSDKHSFRT